MAFCPKILGGGGDLRIIVLLKNEISLSGGDNVMWWGHSNLTSWYKIILNFMHSQVAGIQKLSNFPYLPSASASAISSTSTSAISSASASSIPRASASASPRANVISISFEVVETLN